MIMNGKLAAIRECDCEEDLNYFFKVFGWDRKEHMAQALKEAMGGTFFDLPKEAEKRYEVLKLIFLDGSWRTPYKIQQLKKTINEVF